MNRHLLRYRADEAVGFVGESGCGKSVTARALMRLAPEGTSVALGGEIGFMGQDLLQLNEQVPCATLRGGRIAMVFQDPMTSLNPVMSIADRRSTTSCATTRVSGERQSDER